MNPATRTRNYHHFVPLSLLLIFGSITTCSSFGITSSSSSLLRVIMRPSIPFHVLQNVYPLYSSINNDPNEDDESSNNDTTNTTTSRNNPYQDPNYPELEFIDYSNPDYVVDQGINDEFFSPTTTTPDNNNNIVDDTEDQIQFMREERKRRNDEYQFNTYHQSCLNSGEEYKGEWTVYQVITDDNKNNNNNDDDEEEENFPTLKKDEQIHMVVTTGKKIKIQQYVENENDPFRGLFPQREVDTERIVHLERFATINDWDEEEEGDADLDSSMGNDSTTDGSGISKNQDSLMKRCWPEFLQPLDFRGEAGIMCVGNAYTLCDAIPLSSQETSSGDDSVSNSSYYEEDKFHGPFSEMRTELGIQYKRMRFRVKLDYRIQQQQQDSSLVSSSTPPLYLNSLIVIRETRERWPRYVNKINIDETVSDRLFGPAGALGGLYDPPPVGCAEQAKQYMLMDLEGGATLLFPYKMDQDEGKFDGNGWVTSLDWAPGRSRYQVDRKVLGGVKLRGLRTLELSEVEAEHADQWRPRDGGQNMRQ